jgi:hypothetical protein
MGEAQLPHPPRAEVSCKLPASGGRCSPPSALVSPCASQQFFIECIRDDMHPPLYFLQLHFWSWVSKTDRWLVFNSVLWGLIALISLWIVQKRIRGNTVAWTSAAYLAVSCRTVDVAGSSAVCLPECAGDMELCVRTT